MYPFDANIKCMKSQGVRSTCVAIKLECMAFKINFGREEIDPSHSCTRENAALTGQSEPPYIMTKYVGRLTVLLHLLQKLDNDLTGRTDKNLTLSTLLSV